MRQRFKVVPYANVNQHGIKTRKSLPSLKCLPDLIDEIDKLDSKPSAIKRARLIARYKKIERSRCSKESREMAPKMVNEYLIDVLWLTRGERHPDKAKIDPVKWPRMKVGVIKDGRGKWIRTRRA